MSNNHFHLSITVLLSLGMGYSLSASTATGYPATSAISLGSNPVRSFGGSMNLGTSFTKSNIVSAPADQDLIVTDVLAGLTQMGHNCYSNGNLRLHDDGGTTLANIPIYTTNIQETPTATTSFRGTSGIRIPANTNVHAEWTFGTQDCYDYFYELHYTMGGYLAHP